MTKKMVTMLVILSLFGFSTAHAYDSGDNDEAAGVALVAGLAVVTAAILIASHDRHAEYRPSPRHSPDRSYDSRGNDNYGHHDGRYNDNYQPRDYRHNDNNQYHNR